MDRETLVQERSDAFGQIEANNEKLRNPDLTIEEQDAIYNESDQLFDKVHDLDKKIRFATRKEAAEERFDFDKEFSVVRRPGPQGGILHYKKRNWGDPLSDEDETPNLLQIRDRDDLVLRRWDHGYDALTNEEKVISATKYGGERLTLRWLAGGADPMDFSSDELDILKGWQRDFRNMLAMSDDQENRLDGGVGVAGPANATKIKDFFVPTETERGILYEAQFSGPFGGPGSGYGRWDTYNTGGDRQVNVNTSAKNTYAEYVAEGADVKLLKPVYRLQKLSFEMLAGLMPWTIQADQDAIISMESELRFNLGMAFGNTMNRDLTNIPAADRANRAGTITDLVSMATEGAASPAGTKAPPARITRLAADAVITSNEIIDLKFTIDAAYRNRGQFALMVDDTVALQIEKMREGTGDGAGGVARGAYLYQRPTEGQPGTVHGVPVVRNNAFDSFPSPAAAGNQIVGCMGDFRFFRIGTVRGIAVQVLRELYARQLQIGLLGFLRYGSFIPDRHGFQLIQNKSA